MAVQRPKMPSAGRPFFDGMDLYRALPGLPIYAENECMGKTTKIEKPRGFRSCLHLLGVGVFLLLLLALFAGPLYALRDRNIVIYAFRNFKRPNPTRMILVGEIKSKVKVAKPQDVRSPYVGYDTRLDQVTVRVVNRKGLKVGQKLFVIDKNPHHRKFRDGLISGEISVRSIVYHPFFGWVLTGTGILLRVREGMFVARTLDTEKLARAYELKKRGDYHRNRGHFDLALSSYHSSLEADRRLPEAHWALGRLYLDLARRNGGESPIRALAEFQMAWRSKENFRYDSDKLRYFNDHMMGLYRAYRQERGEARNIRSNQKKGARSKLRRILVVGKESMQIVSRDKTRLLHQFRARYYLWRGLKSQTKEAQLHRSQIGSLLRTYFERPKLSAEAHRIALLYYGVLYQEMTQDKRLASLRYRRADVKEKLLYYPGDFLRWEKVSFARRSSGVERLRRLAYYHGRRYYEYGSARGLRDAEADGVYRRIKDR